MANNNLTSAKKARNDEFYTQYEDIQKEVQAYIDYNPDVFRGKVVTLIVMTRTRVTFQIFCQ